MNLRVAGFVLPWLIVLACASPGSAQTSFGKYNGFYECFQHSFHLSADLSHSKGDKISGSLLITDQAVPWGKRRPRKGVKVEGRFDRTAGTLTLETREKVYVDRDVHEHMRVRASLNARNGYLSGDVVRDGCGTFVLAPEGQSDEDIGRFVRQTINTPARARARIEAEYEATIRKGYVPIELRPDGGILYLQPYLKYTDAGMRRTEQEKRKLLATVVGALERQGLVCVMGSDAIWKGDIGNAAAMASGPTRYLIACLTNCEGLTYFAAGGQGQQSHFGMMFPFPVAALNLNENPLWSVPLHDFQWQFRKAQPGTPDPRIVVTTWQTSRFWAVLANKGGCNGRLGDK